MTRRGSKRRLKRIRRCCGTTRCTLPTHALARDTTTAIPSHLESILICICPATGRACSGRRAGASLGMVLPARVLRLRERITLCRTTMCRALASWELRCRQRCTPCRFHHPPGCWGRRPLGAHSSRLPGTLEQSGRNRDGSTTGAGPRRRPTSGGTWTCKRRVTAGNPRASSSASSPFATRISSKAIALGRQRRLLSMATSTSPTSRPRRARLGRCYRVE
mmetsp:Transcript_16589/g.63063  ORF Transcript_16589/g.63063 Transcript_16589/m.63063 type:complete len:220 (+) Transcript_16589:569-1228(+)